MPSSMVSSGPERATLPEMLVDDGNLIERLRTGDDTAFEELVDITPRRCSR
jgi:hypothetical protein